MTREEREKAIDALKISAPVMAVTQEEFNDYIQMLNKIMNWLEQEPCEDSIVEWKKDFKGYVDSLSMPRDDYKGIMEYIDELPVTPQYTDTEIQKMQDLEFAEIQKAYEIGKDEGSEVHDKIRAELHSTAEMHQDGGYYVRDEWIDEIFDKYKAESEVQDAGCD